MQCNCIDEVEKKLVSAGYEDAKIGGIGFTFTTKAIDVSLNVPVTYKSKKKDGTYAKNRKSLNLLSTYCPFCGMLTKKADLKEAKEDMKEKDGDKP